MAITPCLNVLATGTQLPLNKLKLPTGFSINIFADNIKDARSMALGSKGTIFVGTRSTGKVYALVDQDNNGKADQTYVIANNLSSPNGVAFHDNSLYVAEINRILVYELIEESLSNPPTPKILDVKLPRDRHHGWRYIGFGPDDKLYVSVGAPCNVCDLDDNIYGVIKKIDPITGSTKVVARGVRNSVGFDWDPRTNNLWFNDHGRDWLGDDLPSDELNHLERENQHFGFPYCHQGDTPDPEFGHLRDCLEFTKPVLKLGGHVAPDGLKFYQGELYPDHYKDSIFIAQHGSWNRSTKSGYRIVNVVLDDKNQVIKQNVFIEGWNDKGEIWGRPVDLLFLPDESLLLSDDFANVIYIVKYQDN